MKLLFFTSYFFPECAASSYLGDNLREAFCRQKNRLIESNVDYLRIVITVLKPEIMDLIRIYGNVI